MKDEIKNKKEMLEGYKNKVNEVSYEKEMK